MAEQYTRDELNKLSRQALIELLLSLQSRIAEMDEKLSVLLERLDTSNMKEYGRSTEKLKDIVGEDIFNEADAVAEDDQIQEPDFEEVMKPSLKKNRQVKQKGKQTFSIILTQGLNRQIRRMCEALGYQVTKLKRVRILNILLEDLQPGEYRKIEGDQLEQLYRLTQTGD